MIRSLFMDDFGSQLVHPHSEKVHFRVFQDPLDSHFPHKNLKFTQTKTITEMCL